MCDCNTVYVQKDFNRTLRGEHFRGRRAAVSALRLEEPPRGGDAGVGGVFVLANALLFKFLPDVTICYKCYAQYRQVTPNPDNQPFELGLAEKFNPLDKRANAQNPAAEWKGR